MSNRIISILKKKLARKTWDNWFTTFQVKKVTDDKVIFSVGNLFIKDWLQSKYGNVISKAIKEAYGKNLEYEIVYETTDPGAFNKSDESYKGPLVKKKPLLISNLNANYTFENFVVGPENRVLYAVSMEISRSPGRYNPFFVYGMVGLGKTHLLQAIAHKIMELHPEMRVLYITSEQFMNDMIDSIKSGSVRDFREHYRKKADVLLIDDIQFLIGKNGVQKELFHTFNELYDAGKQIVICSDRNPEELNGFHDRLVSRFQMGMVMEICPPEKDTRFKIAKKFAERESVSLPDDVAQLLADSVDGNLRILRGVIIKLIVQSSINKEKIGAALTNQILAAFNKTTVSIKRMKEEDLLLSAIEAVMGVSPREIKGTSRKQNIVLSRQLLMYILKRHHGKSIKEISQITGKRHSTVIHSIKKIEMSVIKGNIVIKEKLAKILNMMATSSAAG